MKTKVELMEVAERLLGIPSSKGILRKATRGRRVLAAADGDCRKERVAEYVRCPEPSDGGGYRRALEIWGEVV